MLNRQAFSGGGSRVRAAAPTWRDRVTAFPLQRPLHVWTEGAARGRLLQADHSRRRRSVATMLCGHRPRRLTLPRAQVWCSEPVTLLVSLHYGDTRQTRAQEPLLLCMSHSYFIFAFFPSSRAPRPALLKPAHPSLGNPGPWCKLSSPGAETGGGEAVPLAGGGPCVHGEQRAGWAEGGPPPSLTV